MPIHVPSWLRKSLNPSQIIDAFDHYGEKVIDWATREGSIAERALITSGIAAARPLAAIADQLMDAGMPAINLYYGEKYNPFTLKRYHSADPFKQKGGVVNRPSSQLPARRKPRMPVKPGLRTKRARESEQIFDDVTKRARTGQGYPSRMSTFRVSKTLRKQRRSRKPPVPTKSCKRHYDDHGSVYRNHVSWFGFNTHGSMERMYDIVGEAVTKAILAKAKIYPALYDQPLSDAFGVVPNFSTVKLELDFKQIAATGGDAYITDTISNVETLTFKGLATALGNLIQARADISECYYLQKFRLYAGVSAVGNNGVIASDFHMDEMRIMFKTVSQVKLQNVTTNAQGDEALDVIGTNPIAGKRYHFNDQRARLISEIQQANPLYDPFEQREQRINGVMTIGQLGADDDLAHPPKAKQVFTNCRGVANVYMKAGGGSRFTETYSFTKSMRSFIEAIYLTGVTSRPFGKSLWYCFERSYKQNGSTADADSLRVGFNRELSMYCFATFKKVKPMLKHYDNVDIGAV